MARIASAGFIGRIETTSGPWNGPAAWVSIEVKADELPVFWACGVTPQAVVQAANVPFCITHYPGTMLVTDRRNSEFAIM